MDWDRHNPSMMPPSLLRHELNHALGDIDLRPVKLAAVTQSKSGVDADQKERVPFVGAWCLVLGASCLIAVLFRSFKQSAQFLRRQFTSRMTVIGTQPDAIPRIIVETGLVGEDTKDLAQHTHSVVVGRTAEIRSQTRKVLRDGVRRHACQVFHWKVVVFHPLCKVHPYVPLRMERRWRQLVAVRRLDVLVPDLGKREPVFAQPERSEKPLEESLRLLAIRRPRRPTVPLALDAHPHRPSTALLLLEIAHTLFSRHDFSFLFNGL